MAGSMALAISQAERQPDYDERFGFEVPRPARKAAPAGMELAFKKYDYKSCLDDVYSSVRKRYTRTPDSLCDEATSDAIESLLRKQPDLFEGPPNWLGLIVHVAGAKLNDEFVQSRRIRFRSIEEIHAASADLHFGEARLLGSGLPTPIAELDGRDLPVPRPGYAWTREQLIGVVQRFVDDEGRVPRHGDLRRSGRLPHFESIKKKFDSLSDLVRAAGFIPPPGKRPPMDPVEAATKCAAFFRREGHWPGSQYFKYAVDFDLPAGRTALHLFGGESAKQVQLGVEDILTPDEIRKAG